MQRADDHTNDDVRCESWIGSEIISWLPQSSRMVIVSRTRGPVQRRQGCPASSWIPQNGTESWEELLDDASSLSAAAAAALDQDEDDLLSEDHRDRSCFRESFVSAVVRSAAVGLPLSHPPPDPLGISSSCPEVKERIRRSSVDSVVRSHLSVNYRPRPELHLPPVRRTNLDGGPEEDRD